MAKGKKGNKKAITIRIDENTITEFEQTLNRVYGIEQRKKSSTIELLIKQFNQQDHKSLKHYLLNDKVLINLNDQAIQENNAEKQKLLDELVNKDKAIQSLSNKIKEQEKQLTEKQEKIESFNQIIKEKDKTIADRDKTINDKDNTINDKDNTINNTDQARIKAENELNHLNARFNQLQTENNDLQHQNKKYFDAFTELKHLSFFNRVFGKYPPKILELSDNTSKK